MQFFNAGSASIFLTPGVTVSPADDPDVLYSGATTAGQVLGPYDTAKYNSLEILVTAAAGPSNVALLWEQSSGGADVDQASFTTPAGTGQYRTPCKGSFVTITMGVDAATDVVVIASYRQVPAVQYSSDPAAAPSQGTVRGQLGDGMQAWAGGNLAAAGVASAEIISRNGPAHLYFNAGPGSSTWNVDVVDTTAGDTIAGIEAITGTVASQAEFVLPARPVSLVVRNTGATATGFFASVVYTVA